MGPTMQISVCPRGVIVVAGSFSEMFGVGSLFWGSLVSVYGVGREGPTEGVSSFTDPMFLTDPRKSDPLQACKLPLHH